MYQRAQPGPTGAMWMRAQTFAFFLLLFNMSLLGTTMCLALCWSSGHSGEPKQMWSLPSWNLSSSEENNIKCVILHMCQVIQQSLCDTMTMQDRGIGQTVQGALNVVLKGREGGEEHFQKQEQPIQCQRPVECHE